jgi:poly(glycerol-phosphate) alpha-glucosyltransferase
MYSRPRGGLFEAVRQLSLSLEATGVRAEVLSIEEQSLPPGKQSWEPLAHHVMKTRWPHAIGYSSGLRAFLERNQPDIVHTHGIWRYAGHVVNRYCRKYKVPYVVSPHGMLDPWALKTSAWKKRLISFLYETRHLQGAQCLRSLCEAEANTMRNLGLRNPICIIPNGVELPSITDPSTPPWGNFLEPNTRVLLYIGRIHPKKGLPALIRAWAAMRKRRATSDQWALVIVGVDQAGHRAELAALACELGVFVHDTNVRSAPQGGILFLGPLYGSEKSAAYRHADMFILPSLSEGLPLVVLEAWSYGLPVMMTEACNLPEGFAANAALRIEPSAESIARGLDALFQASISDLQSTGSRGRALVAERFAWPKIATEMKSVYEWLLGGGTAPDYVLVN